MKILFVTVNYNQNGHVERLCMDLQNFISVHSVELVVVDNSSSLTSSTGDILTILSPNENLGYLKGLKYGLRSVNCQDFDFVIACNPDIRLPLDFIERISWSCMNMGPYDIYAPSIMSDGTDQNPNLMHKPSPRKMAFYDVLFSSYTVFYAYSSLSSLRVLINSRLERRKFHATRECDEPVEIFLAHGSFLIFKPDFFRDDDFFNADIFLWGEEAIIAGESRLKGGRVYYDPRIVVHHVSHTATGKLSVKEKYKIWKRSYGVYREFLL